MENKTTVTVVIIVLIMLLGGGYWVYNSQHAKHVKLHDFAICIKDSGAQFYGAFWCPHCQNQKALFDTLFESASGSLPYTECSTPDANGQLEICDQQDINIYPTWKFNDGSKREGEVGLQELSQLTACPLP